MSAALVAFVATAAPRSNKATFMMDSWPQVGRSGRAEGLIKVVEQWWHVVVLAVAVGMMRKRGGGEGDERSIVH